MPPQANCLFGLVAFIALAWLVSECRRMFPWRVVIGGLALQFALALFVLKTMLGSRLFSGIGYGFKRVMDSVDAGRGFLFQAGDNRTLLETFAFGILPTVIFFSALMSILYHIGVMQKIVGALAWVMRKSLGTSGAETLAASANVFVGHTEAPLVVRPYLATMTRSELCAMMVGGFATVTGGLLGVYAGMGIDISHLLTASVISAPAALLIAKVMVPETEPEKVNRQWSGAETDEVAQGRSDDVSENLIGAAVTGASDGLKLALNVGAMLIAFLALIALLDTLLESASWAIGAVLSRQIPVLTLGKILGVICAPLAWLMGIPASECLDAGRLIGLKTVANEFIAYAELGTIAKSESPALSQRTITVLTYALAGFSNFGAIGIQVGGIGGLEPSRRSDLAQLGLKTMFGGLLACCMTGAIVGLLL
ncbi:MAG TPA: NupC/NupG family nucleoside CNT transporter [Planctomycetaceae bacterium]|nr:NupC/NupG family nucleoside CNT transporter [Planctomycetaceae bacterium]